MKKQIVNEEYLLSHGFYEYKTIEEGDCCDIPEPLRGWKYFREKKFSRQLFVVVLGEHKEGFQQDYSVYVQDDVGCGFVEIPFPWSELRVEKFESVYYGIRGEKPKEVK